MPLIKPARPVVRHLALSLTYVCARVQSGWNVFDFLVVVFSVVDFVASVVLNSGECVPFIISDVRADAWP